MTVGFAAGETATQSSALAGVTTGETQSAAFSDTIFTTESGGVTSDALATSTLTLGSDGLFLGGSTTENLFTAGKPNYSVSAPARPTRIWPRPRRRPSLGSRRANRWGPRPP